MTLLRCLVCTSEFPPGPGGIGTHGHQLAHHLAKKGWDVVVCTPQDYAAEREVKEFNARQAYRVVRIESKATGPRRILERCARTRRILVDWRPHVVIASGSQAVWVAALLCPWRRVPWLAVGHGLEFGTRRRWRRQLNRVAFGRATAVVCVSEFTRAAFAKLSRAGEKAYVIRNGGDEEAYRPLAPERVRAYRSARGFDADFLLLTVGRVTQRKGQDTVIRALPRILTEMPTARYVIAGLPEDERRLRALAGGLGVADRVQFLGVVDRAELVDLQNACDVFLMTSRHSSDGDYEGFGVAVIEAALCGRPSVVTTGSGLTEAIESGVTGVAVPPGDEAATAAAVLRLKDAETRVKMGQAARERALKQQTWCAAMKEYDLLLRHLSSAPSGERRLTRKWPLSMTRVQRDHRI